MSWLLDAHTRTGPRFGEELQLPPAVGWVGSNSPSDGWWASLASSVEPVDTCSHFNHERDIQVRFSHNRTCPRFAGRDSRHAVVGTAVWGAVLATPPVGSRRKPTSGAAVDGCRYPCLLIRLRIDHPLGVAALCQTLAAVELADLSA